MARSLLNPERFSPFVSPRELTRNCTARMFSMPGLTVTSVRVSPIFFVATGTAASVPSFPVGVFFAAAHAGFVSAVEGPPLARVVFVVPRLTMFLITGAVVEGAPGAGTGDLRSG